MDSAVRNEWFNFFKIITIIVFKISVSLTYSSFFIYALFFARRRRNLSQRVFNIVPFNSRLNDLKKLHLYNNYELLNFYANLIGNVILFIPFPSLLFFLFKIKSRKNIFQSFLYRVAIFHQVSPHAQIFHHGKIGKNHPPFRHMRNSLRNNLMRRQIRDRLALIKNFPLAFDQPGNCPQRCRLACSICAN